MENLAETTFRGASGTAYRFEVHDLRIGFANVGGVYAFTSRMPPPAEENSFALLYVGQAPQLVGRITRHERWSRIELAGCTSICILRVADEARRLEIVADLLAAYATPCNEQ